jgi:predicted transcriptional regulator
MEACYKTLITIFDIVKSDPSPTTYLVTPHEIILRHNQDWTGIQQHFETLAAEKLIIIRQLDKIVVSITNAGVAKSRSLKNNFVATNFSFSASEEVKILSHLKP